MAGLGFDIQKWAIFGLTIGAIHFALGRVINWAGGFAVDFSTVSVAGTRGQFTGLGEMLVNFSPFNTGAGWVSALITSLIAGMVIVLLGRLVLNFIPIDTMLLGTRTAMKRVATTLVIGLLVASFVLTRAGLPGMQTTIALVLWGLVIGWITVQLAGQKWFPIKVPAN